MWKWESTRVKSTKGQVENTCFPAKTLKRVVSILVESLLMEHYLFKSTRVDLTSLPSIQSSMSKKLNHVTSLSKWSLEMPLQITKPPNPSNFYLCITILRSLHSNLKSLSKASLSREALKACLCSILSCRLIDCPRTPKARSLSSKRKAQSKWKRLWEIQRLTRCLMPFKCGSEVILRSNCKIFITSLNVQKVW